MSNETDLSELAKEMQPMGRSTKEYFLCRLASCRQSNYEEDLEILDDKGLSEKALIFDLTLDLIEKPYTEPQFNAKQEFVCRGVRSFMTGPDDERKAFYRIVRQEPPRQISRQFFKGLFRCFQLRERIKQ